MFLPGKIIVTINGLEDYCFTEENNGTKIKFTGLPLPKTGDEVRVHYAVAVQV